MIKRRRIALLSMVMIVVLVLGGLLAYAWIVSGALIHSPQAQRATGCGTEETGPCEDTVLAELQLAPASFEVVARDGTRLAGLHLPARNGATILMTTGFGGGRVYELPAAKMLHDHGFGILLVDFRGRGHSGGDWLTLGRDDVEDLSAVLDFAIANLQVDPEHIGALGPSYGGAMAILLAAADERVKAVVADSPYDVIDATTMGAFIDQPAPIPWLVVTLLEFRLGVDLDRVAPLARIADISPRAVFILDAGSDSVIAPGSGERLHAAAGEPKRLWHEPGLEHTAFRFEMPAVFETNVVAFFEQHLLSSGGGE